mmetsp:Transcript_168495/g.298629  ORF Transcript_168495/g.298629 Transcript_168495/m.298629 type:complete len:448 (+) Transcript_168495:60-1403(+)
MPSLTLSALFSIIIFSCYAVCLTYQMRFSEGIHTDVLPQADLDEERTHDLIRPQQHATAINPQPMSISEDKQRSPIKPRLPPRPKPPPVRPAPPPIASGKQKVHRKSITDNAFGEESAAVSTHIREYKRAMLGNFTIGLKIVDKSWKEFCGNTIEHAYGVEEWTDIYTIESSSAQSATLLGFAGGSAEAGKFHIGVICTAPGYGTVLINELQRIRQEDITLEALGYVVPFYYKIGFRFSDCQQSSEVLATVDNMAGQLTKSGRLTAEQFEALWAEGKDRHPLLAVLRKYCDVKPCGKTDDVRLEASADISSVGEGYLNLHLGDKLNVLYRGSVATGDQGWLYGTSPTSKKSGWFAEANAWLDDNLMVASKDKTAVGQGYLSLHRGERLKVLYMGTVASGDQGWLYGTSLTSGESGWFTDDRCEDIPLDLCEPYIQDSFGFEMTRCKS